MLCYYTVHCFCTGSQVYLLAHVDQHLHSLLPLMQLVISIMYMDKELWWCTCAWTSSALCTMHDEGIWGCIVLDDGVNCKMPIIIGIGTHGIAACDVMLHTAQVCMYKYSFYNTALPVLEADLHVIGWLGRPVRNWSVFKQCHMIYSWVASPGCGTQSTQIAESLKTGITYSMW